MPQSTSLAVMEHAALWCFWSYSYFWTLQPSDWLPIVSMQDALLPNWQHTSIAYFSIEFMWHNGVHPQQSLSTYDAGRILASWVGGLRTLAMEHAALWRFWSYSYFWTLQPSDWLPIVSMQDALLPNWQHTSIAYFSIEFMWHNGVHPQQSLSAYDAGGILASWVGGLRTLA